MSKTCKNCRWRVVGTVIKTGEVIEDWCRVKRRGGLKRACMYWRPKEEKKRGGKK